jgi:hypothetical protein
MRHHIAGLNTGARGRTAPYYVYELVRSGLYLIGRKGDTNAFDTSSLAALTLLRFVGRNHVCISIIRQLQGLVGKRDCIGIGRYLTVILVLQGVYVAKPRRVVNVARGLFDNLVVDRIRRAVSAVITTGLRLLLPPVVSPIRFVLAKNFRHTKKFPEAN